MRSHAPVLEAAWAQPELSWSDQWKIYIRASDPDGDIEKFWLSFSRYGTTLTVPLATQQKKKVNGYVEVWVTLGTLTFTDLLDSISIHLEDRRGNMSRPKEIEFAILSGPTHSRFSVPKGFARNVKLGEFSWPQDVDPDEGDGSDKDS